MSFKMEGGDWQEALKVRKGTLAFPGLLSLTFLRPCLDPGSCRWREKEVGAGQGGGGKSSLPDA